jgi:hypothetical protein
MIRDGLMFKRRELKEGDVEPAGFELATHDEETGKRVGWVPVGEGNEDRWHRDARAKRPGYGDGTYELVGPKIQGNPEKYPDHDLINHADPMLVFDPQPPRDFVLLREWMEGRDIEGIVWHHPDGRMAKLKLRDFGLKRPKG